MSLLATIGLVVFMLLGLLVTFKGFELLKGFVRVAGGLMLSVVMFFFGLFLGAFFGPLWTMVVGIGFAIIGFIIGFLIAPTVLWLLVSIIVFSVFWTLGWSLADHYGAQGIVLYLAAFAAGLIGAYLFSKLAKRLMVGATSALGALMFAVPLFMLLIGPLDVILAGVCSIVSFVVLALAGYYSQRGKAKGDRPKKKRRK